jgi:hypothetical protein
VRKFVRIVLVGGLAVVAAAMILVGSLWAWIWYRSAEVDAYYRPYPLLDRMHAREKQSTNDSEAARQVLLESVPLGTGKEAVIAVLRDQGRFFCKKRVESEADTRLRLRFLESRGIAVAPGDDPAAKDLFECQNGSPFDRGAHNVARVPGICRWPIERRSRCGMAHLPLAR